MRDSRCIFDFAKPHLNLSPSPLQTFSSFRFMTLRNTLPLNSLLSSIDFQLILYHLQLCPSVYTEPSFLPHQLSSFFSMSSLKCMKHSISWPLVSFTYSSKVVNLCLHSTLVMHFLISLDIISQPSNNVSQIFTLIIPVSRRNLVHCPTVFSIDLLLVSLYPSQIPQYIFIVTCLKRWTLIMD